MGLPEPCVVRDTARVGLWLDTPELSAAATVAAAPARAGEAVSVERWHVIDAGTGSVRRYSSTTQAYAEAELASMLTGAGLAPRDRFEAWPGAAGGTASASPFVLVVAERR